MNYDNTKPSTQDNPNPKDDQKKDGKFDRHPGDDDEQKKDPVKPGSNQPEQKKM